MCTARRWRNSTRLSLGRPTLEVPSSQAIIAYSGHILA